MNSRGPPEGGPINSFEIPNIDKVSDTSVNWPADHTLPSSVCEQPRKMNNKLLFLTVSKFSRLRYVRLSFFAGGQYLE